ncbi:MAG: DUF2142 domain-containing protein [Lachnospiraceae bacterium]|nr:DUF2142 domain-containing protein [Lachnospiraceae bacterium]
MAHNHKQIKPEYLFLILSLILGPLYTIFMPLLHLPDELGHFYRVLTLLQGDLFCLPDGEALLPVPVLPYLSGEGSQAMLWSHTSWSLNDAAPTMVSVVNQCLYLPLCYLFQVIGVGIPYLFTHNSIVLLFSGRLVSGLVCTLLIYQAIRLMPVGKHYLALLALMPINLQERFSLSVDNITFAVCVLLIALCLHLRYEPSVSKGKLGLLYATLLFLSSCKVVYFLLALLVLLIPSDHFASKQKGHLHKLCALGMTCVISLGWLIFAGTYLDATKAGANAGEKVVYALSHPFRYLAVILRTQYYWILDRNYINDTVGKYLGLMDIEVPTYAVLVLYVLLIAALFLDYLQNNKRDIPASILLMGTELLIVLAILSSLYVQWTSGAPAQIGTIEGVQGRYYAPIFPAFFAGVLLLLPKINRHNHTEKDLSGILWILFAILFLMQLPVLYHLYHFAM